MPDRTNIARSTSAGLEGENAMKLLALVVLVAGASGLATTPSTAQPISAAQPFYRYCMIGSAPNIPNSCTFNTLEQCQMTATGGVGFCVESNSYVGARQAATIRR
jgi:hypothetical protein